MSQNFFYGGWKKLKLILNSVREMKNMDSGHIMRQPSAHPLIRRSLILCRMVPLAAVPWIAY